MLRQSVGPDSQRRLIRRETALVVLEDLHIQHRQQPVRRVGGDHVHLFLLKGLVEQAQVHRSGRSLERQLVGLEETGQAVPPLLELVAHAERPPVGESGRIAQGFDLVFARVLSADHHREGIIEPQRIQPVNVEALSVFGPHACQRFGRSGRGRGSFGGAPSHSC